MVFSRKWKEVLENLQSGDTSDSKLTTIISYIENFYYKDVDADTLVNGNKKLRLDIVFDSIASAIDIIQQIKQSFRGFVFFTTGKIKVVIDKPGTVTQMFSMGNIIAGSFSVSKKSNKDYIKIETRDTVLFSGEGQLKRIGAKNPTVAQQRAYTSLSQEILKLLQKEFMSL